MKPIKIDNKHICGYSVSPYNFVTLPAFGVARYNSIDEMPKHNFYKDKTGRELLNGTIEYAIKAKTPMLISKGGNKDKNKNAYFFKNNKGEYTIPGSTIRGMIKNNCEILSFSSIVGNKSNKEYLDSEIQDMKFLYRGLADEGSISKDYNNRLGIKAKRGKKGSYSYVENVKAGYIYKKDKESYGIIPAIKDIKGKYYRRIREDDLRTIIDNDFEKNISFMYSDKILNKSHPKKNPFFHKYQQPISFEISNEMDKITKLGKLGRYNKKGYIICSAYMNSKLAHFIINEMDSDAGEIEISVEDIRYYNNDLIRTKKMKKNGTMNEKNKFYGLPSKKGIENSKPVFYIENEDTKHFGFTPYLRVFYDHSILEGVPNGYKDIKGISYSDGIFGFANKLIVDDKKSKNISYKTRVSFEDVIVKEKACIDNDSSKTMMLAEPKATCFNLYLKQDQFEESKKLFNYNNEDFKIRGVKQYWLKDYITIPENIKNTNMSFNIFPLKEGTEFKGKIHFNNLYEDELGLLLWSLKLNEGCYQNIGMGKPYGFGRVKVDNIKLSLENLQNKYNNFEFNYMDKNHNIDKYIKDYKQKFNNEYLNGGKEIDDMLPVKELMYIKSKVVTKEERYNYRYMEMSNKVDEFKKINEFKKRRTLPVILQFENEKLLNDIDHKARKSKNHKNNNKHNRYDNNRNNGYNNKRKNGNNRYNNNSSNINNSMAEQLAKLKF